MRKLAVVLELFYSICLSSARCYCRLGNLTAVFETALSLIAAKAFSPDIFGIKKCSRCNCLMAYFSSTSLIA